MEVALLPARLPETAHRHGCCIKINLCWKPSCGYICISKSSLHLQLKSIMCTYFTLTVTLLSVKRLFLLQITAHYSGIYSPCLWTGSISFMRVRWCDIIPPRSGFGSATWISIKAGLWRWMRGEGTRQKWACNPSPVASQNAAPSAQSDERRFLGAFFLDAGPSLLLLALKNHISVFSFRNRRD